MTENKEKKNILIGGLLVAIIAMAVGYAALAQQLTINGTAQVTSTWDVHFDTASGTVTKGNDDSKTPTVTANAATMTGTSATFDVEFGTPGDYAEYTFTVKNTGTLAAKLSDVTLGATDAATASDTFAASELTTAKGLNYSITIDGKDVDTAKNTTIAAETGTSTVVVKVWWDKAATTVPEKTAKKLSVALNYVQA